MTPLDVLLQNHAWFMCFFVLVTLLLVRFSKRDRPLLGALTTLFVVSMAGHYMAHIFDASGMSDTALIVRKSSFLLEGSVIIGLVGILIFSLLAPMVGYVAPRIMHDVVITLAHMAWIVYCLKWIGFDVIGLVATSAVITAVIGLSLQDTLGNVVGGLAVQVEKSLEAGDWIKVGDLVGRISEIGWRHTAVETRNWETILFPNSMLVKNSVIVLGRRRDQALQWRRWVWFNVDFRFAPDAVIETVTTALRQAEIPNVAADPPPNCVAMDFSDSWVRYAVRYWLTDLAKDDPTDSEVRTHLFTALQRAAIPLSMPAHAVFMTEETTERKLAKAEREIGQRLKALSGVELLAGLSEDDRRLLADNMVYAPFAKGDAMTKQGFEAHWIYIIISGHAERVYEGSNKVTTKVSELGPGHVFGEYSVMTGQPREVSVIATTAVTCYRLAKGAFQELLSRRPELAEQMSQILARNHAAYEEAVHKLDDQTRSREGPSSHEQILAKIRHAFGLG